MKFLKRLKRMYHSMTVGEYIAIVCIAVVIMTFVIIHNGGK